MSEAGEYELNESVVVVCLKHRLCIECVVLCVVNSSVRLVLLYLL